MVDKLNWIKGPWSGKLAVSARPRGGDWLADQLATWKRNGISSVLSLLTPEEEEELGLQNENREARNAGMTFRSLPIPDRGLPFSESELTAVIEELDGDLSTGKNVLVHCRQGIGRTGIIAACLLISRGETPDAAIKNVSEARGAMIPDTSEQREWIEHYPAVTVGSKRRLTR